MSDALSAPDGLPDRPFDSGAMLTGFGIIAAFLAGLTAWSLLAPIESAVVAPGVVSVEGNVKTLQHLEGGIVEAILVGEGDRVKSGDILIRLETTAALSALNEVQAQYVEARATEARLIKHATSGDVNGDYSHVVGYAALLIS
jgi:multidrug efflux pump subunit AcrA (membrane-fusion protein)